jgi:exonuclease VII small subunit
MNNTELQYLKRAVAALEAGTLTLEDEIKILRTVSQISQKASKVAQEKLVDSLIV